MTENWFFRIVFIFMISMNTLLFVGCTHGQSSLTLPSYDSTSSIISKGRLYQKEFYKKKKLKCRVIYADDKKAIYNLISLYTPVNGYDSCYIYYNDYTQNVYLYNDSCIVNDQYSDVSLIYKHRVIDSKTNNVLENGCYYIERASIQEICFDFMPKYKIGKWKSTVKNKIVEIDYDRNLINGKPIVFDSGIAVINKMKKKCDSLLIDVFGIKFVNQYIVFNIDKTTFSSKYFPRSPYHSTYDKLLTPYDGPIEFADLCYDIKISDTLRFNTISLRIEKDLNFIFEKQHDIFSNAYKYPCVGLDRTLKKGFHNKIADIKKIAKNIGLNTNSRYFSIELNWEHTEGLYGKLFFIVQEIIPINDYQRMFKIVRIDPSNAEIKIVRDDTNMMKNNNDSAVAE